MKKFTTIVVALLMTTTIFAQSKEYSAYLKKAKEYEAKKQWAFALDAYYDALNCDDEPLTKEEALTAYNNIKTAISSGNPGLGKYNAFTMHDEWKKLLIDAEKLGSSICLCDINVGNLVQGKLDYETRTATYYSKIDTTISDRYNNTISIIASGYNIAYKTDWTDLVKPENWPIFSVSHSKNGVYNENGALIIENNGEYCNAFYVSIRESISWGVTNYRALYDFKFNIVDENGKEIVKGKRWLGGTEDNTITFTGIKPEIMDLIDNEQAFINLQTVYLEYGHYNREDDQGGRTFIKNFPEVEISKDKIDVQYGGNNKNIPISNFNKTNVAFALNDYFTTIPGKTYKTGKTEVTQSLYEAVMGENPSNFKDANLPAEKVSWYDAIYFCNKLSIIEGKQPVYAVSGITDVTAWGYTPHNGRSIKGTITQNLEADGYRLPSVVEWEYAARGGEYSDFSGSDNLDEVAWNYQNSEGKTHPVAEKKANGYGLYDMTGNVDEWVWSITRGSEIKCYCKGGDYSDLDSVKSEITYNSEPSPYSQASNIGFRLFASLTGDELAAAKQETEEKNKKIIEEIDNSFIKVPGKTYQIAKTEVTQNLYEAVMGENPFYYKFDNLPAENVSWYDAIYFCNKLSAIKGKAPVYAVDDKTDITEWNYTPHKGNEIKGTITQNLQANGYRLPSAEEWEYAARGGKFFTYSGSNNIDEVAWNNNNSKSKTHPVAEKKANGYGLYDMSGNVNEWVWHDYDNGYYRGGGYYKVDSYYEDNRRYCEVMCSNKTSASNRERYIGFRLSLSLEENEKKVVKQEVEAKNKKIIDEVDNSLVKIPYETYMIGKTEVTQSLYEAVMGENPSEFKFENLPAERVSAYDALYFCNKLSILKGKEPVYAVNGKTDVTEWNYIPHKGKRIYDKITQNEKANGYRLPTGYEWRTAARGGKYFKYSGSENIDEVAWYQKNSTNKTHPVAEKKANDYGLYDMSGNVYEWYGFADSLDCRGGSYYSESDYQCEVTHINSESKYDQKKYVGFRLTISLEEAELAAAKQEIEARDKKIIAEVDNSFIQIPGKNYMIEKTEVTQLLYKIVMGENPSDNKFDNLPVEKVSWYDAIYFCNKLSVMKGKEPVYAVNGKTDIAEWNYTPNNVKSIRGTITQNTLANGYRLLTAEEWEQAARGGETYNYAGSDNVDEVAWYDKNSERKTHPAGEKKSNGYGLYDMCGNVYEWVWDTYPENDSKRYFYGGSWKDDYYSCKVADKDYGYADSKYENTGFRLIISSE